MFLGVFILIDFSVSYYIICLNLRMTVAMATPKVVSNSILGNPMCINALTGVKDTIPGDPT